MRLYGLANLPRLVPSSSASCSWTCLRPVVRFGDRGAAPRFPPWVRREGFIRAQEPCGPGDALASGDLVRLLAASGGGRRAVPARAPRARASFSTAATASRSTCTRSSGRSGRCSASSGRSWAAARRILPVRLARRNGPRTSGRDREASLGRLRQIHTVRDCHLHEIVHLVAAQIGDPGPFFQEGLAVALSGSKWRGQTLTGWPAPSGRPCAGNPPRPSLRALRAAASPTSAYPLAGSFVAFLIKTHGVSRVGGFFRACGGSRGRHAPPPSVETFGVTPRRGRCGVGRRQRPVGYRVGQRQGKRGAIEAAGGREHRLRPLVPAGEDHELDLGPARPADGRGHAPSSPR